MPEPFLWYNGVQSSESGQGQELMPKNDSFGTPANSPLPDWWHQIAAPCLVVFGVVMLALLFATSFRMSFFPVEGPDPGTWAYSPAFLTWITLGTFQLACVLLMMTYVQSQFPGKLSYTFAWKRPYTSANQTLSTVLVIIAVLLVVSWIAFNFFWSDVERDLRLFKRLIGSSDLKLPILVLCIGAPLTEELLFRGYLFGRLSNSQIGPVGAALVTTIGWTLLHWGYSIVGIIEVFIAGLLFSWALWRTGSLWVPLCLHAIYNATVLTVITSMP